MKLKQIMMPLLLVASLVSCDKNNIEISEQVYCFDTVIDIKLYEGNKDNLSEIADICRKYDAFSDNYSARSSLVNIYSINHNNDEISIDKDLYKMLEVAFSTSDFGASNFDPLCGLLSKAWKDSLKDKKILDENFINKELNKMNNTSLIFKDNNVVNRIGEAEIDLGGIAKGYTLDQVYDYLSSHNIKHYLINGGASSILLGEKNNKDGLFNVAIDTRILHNSYLKLNNCFISTSATYTQGMEIDNKMYSHIIDPVTGNAINKQDAVIVISNKGYVGDALSTSMMLNTVDEIKQIEKEQDVKCIVVKNKEIVYCHNEIEVLHH